MKGMILQVADEKNQVDKEALKAQKQAEKEALKAKKERIKQSKPKKSENVFVRMGKAIKKFFKDFRGTCKKVIWPDRKTVLKNSLIVFVTVLIIGVGIWIIDFAFSKGIRGVQSGITSYAERVSEDEAESESLELEGVEPTSIVATTSAASTTAAETAAD